MAASESVLIVEDDEHWRAIYKRAANKLGFAVVEESATYVAAESLLRSRQYAVAFIDIGLDVEDDNNKDGLRVMELLRSLGDETSIIVVTGRSGNDVVQITQDAVRRYRAFETLSKALVEPAEVQALLAGALVAFKENDAHHAVTAHEALRGSIESSIWDDRMMRALKFGKGVSGLYGFLDTLFARFLPVVARSDFTGLRIDPTDGVAHAAFWSRGAGRAVALILGPQTELDSLASVDGAVLGYEVGEVLCTAASGEVKGVVYAVPDARAAFAGPA